MSGHVQDIINSLSEEDIKSFKRFQALTLRISILEGYKDQFKDIFSGDSDLFASLFGKSNNGDIDDNTVGLVVIQDWLDELKKERDALYKHLATSIYSIDLKTYVEKINSSITKTIEDGIPEKFAKEFIKSIGKEDNYAFTIEDMTNFMKWLANSMNTIKKATDSL